LAQKAERAYAIDMRKKRKRRIAFGESDAAHLYSLAVENFCVSKKEGVCFECLQLKQRIEKFIGEKETKSIQRQVKKYPN
jgi:hypothetical protein